MKMMPVMLLLLASNLAFAQDHSEGKTMKTEKKIRLPEGMVYIPSGTFGMESFQNHNLVKQNISLSGYFMDAREVTNRQYRDFTDDVRDSAAGMLLGNFIDKPDGTQQLIRKQINWDDPKVQESLAPMYCKERTGFGTRLIDASHLIYHYTIYDYKAAAKQPLEPKIKFTYTLDVPIYPDTTVWKKQLKDDYNDPVLLQYYWFRGFDQYPVAGVNWIQANAYCDWRTRDYHANHKAKNKQIEGQFRLPTDAEWEWAAKGGNQDVNIIMRKGVSNHGAKLAAGEKWFYTSPGVDQEKNGYGLYNMSDNMSEWTISDMDDIDLNNQEAIPAQIVNGKATLKVIRGGNWLDAPEYLKIGTRGFEHPDSGWVYIGFRCIFNAVILN